MAKLEQYIRYGLISISCAGVISGLIDSHYNVELPREANAQAAYNEVIASILPPSPEALNDAKTIIKANQKCSTDETNHEFPPGKKQIIYMRWRNNDTFTSCDNVANQLPNAVNAMTQQTIFDEEFARARDRRFAESSKRTGIVYEDRAKIDAAVVIGGYLTAIASAVGIGLTRRRS